MPDAQKILRLLTSKAFLVLLTKGDPLVQDKRIADSGLKQYFDAIHIVDKKTKKTFADLGQQFDVAPEKSWSIGNSLISDIDPAVRAGWSAIWIDAYVWEHERREVQIPSEKFIVLHQLADLPETFQTILQSNCNNPIEKGRAYS